MNKPLVILLLSFSVLLNVSAQKKGSPTLKKDIAQAKAYLKAGNNLDKAEQLMQNQLKDTANHTNEKLWLILFDAVKKQYEQGNEKLYLKQKYDTASFFNLTKRMFTILEAFDSIDALPNEQGESRPQYRKKHADYLADYRHNLYNGGIYFIGKQKFSEAYSFLDLYLDCAHQPLFSQYRYNETDTLMPQAAYWAVYCGYKNKDPKATLHHTYLALRDTAHYCLMLQYLAETYKLECDTTRYVSTLLEGFNKYPGFPFFFPRLVEHYAEQNSWSDVLTIANQALAHGNSGTTERSVRSKALLNLRRYDECIAASDSVIAVCDSIAEVWYNAGMACLGQAAEIDKNMKPTTKQRQLMMKKYERACHYLEHFRQLAPDQQNRWAWPLYTIYLNLNKGPEFDEMDRIIRKGK